MIKTGKILILLSFFLTYNIFSANNINLKSNRRVIRLGEATLLQLEIRGNYSISEVIPPKANDFEIVSLGTSSNISIINGIITHKYTYNFQLFPKKKGTLKIPSFKVKINGKILNSNTLTIEVISNMKNNKKTNYNENSTTFFRLETNKKEYYPNEPIILEYVLYTRVNFRNPQLIKEPSFDNFIVHDLENLSSQKIVNINGYEYYQIKLARRLLYPIKPGEYKMGESELQIGLIMKDKRMHSFFDDFDDIFKSFDRFFNDDFLTPFTRMIPKRLISKPIFIKVKDFPDKKPDDFTGLIGDFSISAIVKPTKLKAGDAATLKIVIKGNGNLENFEYVYNAGDSFKTFDPKTNVTYEIVDNTVYSKFESEIVFFPKRAGKFQLNPIKITFFNPNDGKYHTLTVKLPEITVKGNFKSKELLSTSPISNTKSKDKQNIEKKINSIRYLKEDCKFSNYSYKHKWKLLTLINTSLLILPGLLWGLIIIVERFKHSRWRKQKKAYLKLKQSLEELKHIDSKEFYPKLSECFRQYFRSAYNFPNWSNNKEFEKLLNNANFDKNIIKELLKVYNQIYENAYKPGIITADEREKIINTVLKLTAT